MALSWKIAQENEKKFWRDIYVNEKIDDVYKKSKDVSWKFFTLEILKRHNLEKKFLNNKVILDLGSGPAGIAKGLQLLLEENEIQNCNIIAVDPLMNFYKEEIGLLKETGSLKLLTNKGENIDVSDNSVDIIFSTNVLDHCENPDEVIRECFRILKPGGYFYPSLHITYNYLKFLSKYIKYFDKNHPHHFTENQMIKKFEAKFSSCEVNSKFTIKQDQEKFNLISLLKSKDKFRALKRYISNFVLYTCYFSIKKN